MKIGFRTPNLKKSLKARTTGKINRKVKKAINPLYGKKGMGFIKNPKKSVNSMIYKRTTFGLPDIVNAATFSTGKKKKMHKKAVTLKASYNRPEYATNSTELISSTKGNPSGIFLRTIAMLAFVIGIVFLLFSFWKGLIIISLSAITFWIGGILIDRSSRKSSSSNNTFEDIQFPELNSLKEESEKVTEITIEKLPLNFADYDLSKSLDMESNKSKLLADISKLNRKLLDAKTLCPRISFLRIPAESLSFSGSCPTYLEKRANLKSGKLPKYPLCLHYRTNNFNKPDPADNYFGDIYYLKSGEIGKAELICWVGKSMTIVHLTLIDGMLEVKRIEILNNSNIKETIYKI